MLGKAMLGIVLGSAAFATPALFHRMPSNPNTDLTIVVNAEAHKPTGRYRYGFDNMVEVFGTPDVVANCYSLPERRNALVLRAGKVFYAMNGHARSYLAGGIVYWGSKETGIQIVARHDPKDRYISAMIKPGLEACST